MSRVLRIARGGTGAVQDLGVAPRRAERSAGAVVRAEVGHGCAELVADPDRPTAWTLLVDGTAQSHVDLDDPTHLEFEYVRRTGHLLDALDPAPPAPLRVLHLGGGGASASSRCPVRRTYSNSRCVGSARST